MGARKITKASKQLFQGRNKMFYCNIMYGKKSDNQ